MRQQAQHRDFFNLAAKLCVLAAQNLFDILFYLLVLHKKEDDDFDNGESV